MITSEVFNKICVTDLPLVEATIDSGEYVMEYMYDGEVKTAVVFYIAMPDKDSNEYSLESYPYKYNVTDLQGIVVDCSNGNQIITEYSVDIPSDEIGLSPKYTKCVFGFIGSKEPIPQNSTVLSMFTPQEFSWCNNMRRCELISTLLADYGGSPAMMLLKPKKGFSSDENVEIKESDCDIIYGAATTEHLDPLGIPDGYYYYEIIGDPNEYDPDEDVESALCRAVHMTITKRANEKDWKVLSFVSTERIDLDEDGQRRIQSIDFDIDPSFTQFPWFEIGETK